MPNSQKVLIVGGGTAGWLSAAYLAQFLRVNAHRHVEITLIESPEIGAIGVGEASFPTIRKTLKFLDIDEAQFMREASATFKQGIKFVDWVKTPVKDQHEHYFHPFEAPYYAEGADLVPYWLLQDEKDRLPFAQAMTFQKRVADARRAPKRPHEGDYAGPLNYAYHFDATNLAQVLAGRAKSLGVKHIETMLVGAQLNDEGAIDSITTQDGQIIKADLYIDCSGFRAELIAQAMNVPFRSARSTLFTDRVIACKVPYDQPDAPLESYTVSTAHEAGWTWDIGLNGVRGIGCVYSSDHISDERADDVLRAYLGPARRDFETRRLRFEPGYREKQWVKNCVAIGLSGGFLEPLESTGVVMIEVAVNMLAELFPHNGPIDAPAARFNELMAQRYENIITFLKLHYVLSQRQEPFWRQNRDLSTVPERLKSLLEQWRYRPPNRFDFLIDLESFAYFNYQYILYGMGFKTDISAGRSRYRDTASAEQMFTKIHNFGERATLDLPAHRTLIQRIYSQGFAD